MSAAEPTPTPTPSSSPPPPPAERSPRCRWVARLRNTIVWAAAAGLVYAIGIEPRWLEVVEEDVGLAEVASAELAPAGMIESLRPSGLRSPLKVCHLTDLQLSSIGMIEESVLARIAEKRPDVVVVSGDNIDGSARYDLVAEFLARIDVPLGVWVVKGNWEHWHPAKNARALIEGAGARLLVNQSGALRDDVWIIGLDDTMAGVPDPAKAFKGVPDDVYRIALLHSPAGFDPIADRCDIAFSGHTHGGQIRIPFVPAVTPRGSGSYVSGWYERGRARMYVSRGVGTSVIPVRFRCRPELAFFTLRPDS